MQIPSDDPQTSLEETPPSENPASVLINLEQLIKNHISSIARLEEETSKHQGLVDDILNNDETYKKHTEIAKEAGRVKSATKLQILKQPQAAELSQKVQTMRSELKELQGALSDYLKEYQRMSGVNEIEGEDGEVREIVSTMKLIKKSFRP